MSSSKKCILWFRQDLRLSDNTALLHAVDNGYTIYPVFILDNDNAGEWRRGEASRWWLYKSLQALNSSIDGALIFRAGNPQSALEELVDETGAQAIFWNRCYEPWRIKRDKDLKNHFKDKGLEVESFKDFLLWEPWEIKNQQGEPYKVFTPFYRKGCLQHSEPDKPRGKPENADWGDFHGRYDASHLDLLPKIQWYRKLENHWTPGETGAKERLDAFLDEGMKHYKNGRDRPDQENTSRLSPHLHHGEISPRQVWHAAQARGAQAHWESDADKFCSEIGWREFSYNLLYNFPQITREPLQEKFENFPWADNRGDALKRWQRGNTGIPIVDAGMRELWETGWMHNRVRMIVGSLLVKNMLLHWHHGEDWFWDCLVDADLGNNSASWQWIAGCGADAAPYFRIFNPVTQGEKFDPNGDYVRKYVPEIAHLDNKYIHKPWESDNPPAAYPAPIVDLKASRTRALEAFEKIKKSS